MIRREYTIEKDDDNGFWMLLEDGVGIARSKSRNSLKRIRDALWAVEGGGLIGLTVEEDIDDHPRGVVQAISGNDLIVRLVDGKLDVWHAGDCRLIEPERPDKPTPWNDPAIGIYPAVALLQRVLACGIGEMGRELEAVAIDIEIFLRAREAAQPT